MINLVLILMLDMFWVLVPPTSPPRKFILAQTPGIGYFGHLSAIVHHSPSLHVVVGMDKLVLLVVPHLVLFLVMLEVLWVLGLHISTPRKLVVGLMVVFFLSSRSRDASGDASCGAA